jgi:two-component system sensor histidine kinase/response regulator
MKGKKVLLVEDNSINQQIVVDILESIDLIIDVANDGLEAIELVKSQSVDTYCLILMDLHMPNLGGYDAARLIKADDRYSLIPIVAMTAEVLSDTEKRVYEAGMQGYITKPIDIHKLFTYIGSLNCSQKNATDINSGSINMDILDYNMGIGRLVNNKSKYNKILKDFVIEYENIYEKLVTCLEIDDYEGFEFLTHTLKGTAGNISANKLYFSAANLNALIKQQLYKECTNSLKDFKLDLAELYKAIDDYLLKNVQDILPLDYEVKSAQLDVRLIENTFNELLILFDEDYGDVENKLRILENMFENSIYKNEWEELVSKTNIFDIDGAKYVIRKIGKALGIDLSDKK